MINSRKLIVLVVSLAVLLACAKTAPPVQDTAADKAAVRAAGTARDKAYNAGDGAAVAALYAEDAVLSASQKQAGYMAAISMPVAVPK